MLVLSQKRTSDVLWTSPSAGDTFGPGDTIIAKWTGSTTTSPSFRLCLSSGDGCGSVVWPEVQQSAGQYVVSMATPKVESDEEFYLEMKDDSGNTVKSPVFSLSVTTPATPSSSSAPSSSALPTPVADPAALTPNQQPLAPSPNPNTIPPNDNNLLTTTSHSTPSSALFAIPLSIVGAILIIATLIAIRHARSTREARIQEAERLKLQRSNSLSSFMSGKTREDQTFSALGISSHHREAPVPLFMGPPTIERKPRLATRQVYRDEPREYCEPSSRYPSSQASSTRERPRDTSSTWSARDDYDNDYYESRDVCRDDSQRSSRTRRYDSRSSRRDRQDYTGSRSRSRREYDDTHSSRSGREYDVDDSRPRHSRHSRRDTSYSSRSSRNDLHLSIPPGLTPGLNSPQKLHVRVEAPEYDYVFDNNATSPVPGDRRQRGRNGSVYGAVAEAVHGGRHGGRFYDY